MLPIQSLLQRIRWDPAFGDADFTIGYYDRAQHAIVTVPFERIRLQLEFLKPFKAVSTSEFEFKAEGSQTALTWSMYGKNNFMAKAISLFMDCDKMVGGQFEQGLAQMKAVVETAPKP